MAVSGGPDSLALLLLAAAARPNAVQAVTVDHRLRSGSDREAELVATVCTTLGVPHTILPIDWTARPTSNLQALARERRYALLGRWARDAGIAAIATAHHADDQAETLLMRLARGSGVAGLCGIRPTRSLDPEVDLIRPLLGWRRSDLHAIVSDAGLTAVDDPSNRSHRFDRTAARDLLGSAEWLQADRVAAAASHCRDAETALAWAAAQEWKMRVERDGDAVLLRVDGLPRELKRRLLLMAVAEFRDAEPAGPDLMSAFDRLEAGGVTTLAGLKLQGGPKWRLSPAPLRTPRGGL